MLDEDPSEKLTDTELEQKLHQMRQQYPHFGETMGSSDLYGTGSQIFKMIISNNLRVYNTRVRSDCKSKKVILKNSRFLLVSVLL